MSSSWIVTTTTLFRLIAVVAPLKSRILITKKVAYYTLAVIYGFGLISIIPIYSRLMYVEKCTKHTKIRFKGLGIQVLAASFIQKVYTPGLNHFSFYQYKPDSFILKNFFKGMQVMCFYLPWIIALFLWFFLLRSLKNHDKNLHYSFGNVKRCQSINNSNTDSNIQLFKGKNRKNSSYLEMKHRLTKSTPNTAESSINSHNKKVISISKLRSRNVNKISLTVVVLCFTNLICRYVFTVLIFKVKFFLIFL